MWRSFVLLSACYLLHSQNAMAQLRDSLVGNWKVYDVTVDKNDSLVNDLEVMLAERLFVGATYHFGQDSIYNVHIADLDERGKWWVGEKDRKILFKSEKGEVAHKGTITEIKVSAIASHSLVLKRDEITLMLNRVD